MSDTNVTTPKDHAWVARTSLGAAGRADSLRVRQLHVAMASSAIASLAAELDSLRIMLASAEAELVRLADAEKDAK